MARRNHLQGQDVAEKIILRKNCHVNGLFGWIGGELESYHDKRGELWREQSLYIRINKRLGRERERESSPHLPRWKPLVLKYHGFSVDFTR